MTAGTKALLLLSVVGLIVLVAWYGDGPPQEDSSASEVVPAKVKDPLLASATTSRPVRASSSSSSSTVRPGQPSRAETARTMRTRTVSERWGDSNQTQARRQSPPPPPARSMASQKAASKPSENTARQTPTLTMGSDLDSTVPGTWSQARWNALRDKIEAGASQPVSSSRPGTTDQSDRSGVVTPSSSKASARSSQASTPKPSAPTSREASTHKVRPGDTLGHIAQQYYGAASRWHRIAEANPGVDPSSLRVGQELVIPPGPRANRSSSTTRQDRPQHDLPQGRTHTIGEGETLSSIAEDHLGHERHWYKIYEINEKRIGDNPDRLVLGMVIAIP